VRSSLAAPDAELGVAEEGGGSLDAASHRPRQVSARFVRISFWAPPSVVALWRTTIRRSVAPREFAKNGGRPSSCSRTS
jgi:hypothetical protein